MRIFKGLDNIHAVIDRHESEWRKENGEPEPRTPDKVAEAVRQRIAARPDAGSGRFDEERFLHGTSKPAKKKEPEAPVIAPESTKPAENAKLSADRFLGGSETVTTSEPEAVEIVRNKEGRHSWLYNEVMKAINDAAKGTSAKIIAVFVPVVQNSKEFEDLPAAETVTTSPIDESLAKIEAPESAITPEPVIIPEGVMPAENESPSEDLNLIPEIPPEQKAEIAETLKEMEEKFDEVLQEEKEAESEPEPEIAAEELTPAVVIDESESETPGQESEPEISTVAEILEDSSDDDIFTEELSQAITTPDDEPEYEREDESDILQDGEPMDFEEIENVSNDSGHEELSLTDELDDDEIFDESITEIRKPDDDDDEIEIIPDPEK